MSFKISLFELRKLPSKLSFWDPHFVHLWVELKRTIWPKLAFFPWIESLDHQPIYALVAITRA